MQKVHRYLAVCGRQRIFGISDFGERMREMNGNSTEEVNVTRTMNFEPKTRREDETKSWEMVEQQHLLELRQDPKTLMYLKSLDVQL